MGRSTVGDPEDDDWTEDDEQAVQVETQFVNDDEAEMTAILAGLVIHATVTSDADGPFLQLTYADGSQVCVQAHDEGIGCWSVKAGSIH
jgi:hypothetical protein